MRPVHVMAFISVLMAPSFAAGTRAADSPWSVRVWQSDGLPDRHINGLAQGDDGFLWLLTSYHVARFDGVRFETFATSDLAPRATRTLLLGRDGLLVTTNRGPAVRLRPGAEPVLIPAVRDWSADVAVETDDGAVWIGYHDGRAARLQEGRVTTYGPEAGLPATGSCWLARDRRGHLWYAQAGHVGVFAEGRFRPLVTLPNAAQRVAAARDGGVWIAAGPQIFRYEAGGALVAMGALPAPHQGARASVLLETRDGALWIGTRHDGLFRRTDAGVEAVPSSHPAIRCLLEDREGNVWVGTGGGGLNRVLPRVLEIEGTRTGVSSKLLQTVAEDTHGALWGTTRHGQVVRRREGGWETAAPGATRLGAANCVTADPLGGIWIGTRSSRVHRWVDRRLTTWESASGLRIHGTCAMVATRAGDVWMAGEQGVDGVLRAAVERLRGGRLERFAVANNVRRLFAAAEDKAGAVWIGGAHGVLLRSTGGPPEEVKDASRAVASQVRALHAGSDGSLWIGYEGGGLGRFKDGRFRRLGAEHGLAALDVAQIVDDRAGSLWLGTESGLLRMPRADVEAVLEGRASRLRPEAVKADEGSFTVSAASCGWSPAVLTAAGEIWMPMGTALLIVHPRRVPAETGPPRAVLTRVGVDGVRRAVYGDFIHHSAPTAPVADLRGTARVLPLRPGDRRLEIEFTSPTFRAPEEVRFRHRLDGYDEGWVDAGTDRVARYARLPPGAYRFRVSACSGETVCEEPGAALALAIAPLFWQTWWFRLLALGAFAAAVAGLVRYVSFRRLRRRLAALQQQAALDRERTRIARDIHDDVGNRLNRITLLSELALRNGHEPAHMKDEVREISSAVRDVIGALDEVVWAVSPRHDTLPHLVSRLGQFAAEYLRAAGVRCELVLPAQPPEWALSAEVRHNVLCTVKEALTNAVRHGRPQAVKLAVEVAGDSLAVVIEDDGAGFDGTPSDPGADGLRNMRQRMAEIGGEIAIESTAGRGTHVRLCLPRARPFPPGQAAV